MGVSTCAGTASALKSLQKNGWVQTIPCGERTEPAQGPALTLTRSKYFLNCLDLNHKSPDSGERQCNPSDDLIPLGGLEETCAGPSVDAGAQHHLLAHGVVERGHHPLHLVRGLGFGGLGEVKGVGCR